MMSSAELVSKRFLEKLTRFADTRLGLGDTPDRCTFERGTAERRRRIGIGSSLEEMSVTRGDTSRDKIDFFFFFFF